MTLFVLLLPVSDLVQRVRALPAPPFSLSASSSSSSPSTAASVRVTCVDCWLVLAAPSVQRCLLRSIQACLHEVVEREAVPRVSYTHSHTTNQPTNQPTSHSHRGQSTGSALAVVGWCIDCLVGS